MDCVYVKNYLSEAEMVSSVSNCKDEAEYSRALDNARRGNAQPQPVEVVAWGESRRYAAVKAATFTDTVKVVEVESQTLVAGNYGETSFYPTEMGLTKLKELDG